MAKSGRPSQVGQSDERGDAKRRLIEAATETLRTEGFAGASARTIARRADCNQGLVFYHFGTVANLLLAALDETSRVRMERYRESVAGVSGPAELVGVAADIYREDLDAGHIAVLAGLIAGAATTPGLGPEVAARVEPWIRFTEGAVGDLLASTPFASLIDPSDAAYAVVALYLGVEMLSHLGADRSRADSLLDSAGRLAGLLAALAGPPREAGAPQEAGTPREARTPKSAATPKAARRAGQRAPS
jgi:AcrR family transcriptional regulator